MRIRAVVAIVLLVLPGVLSAQRLPRIGRPRPTRPQPLPPQPAEITRQLAYVRSHVSYEEYPLVSYINAPGYIGKSHWTSFGMGTRIDYRFNRFVSGTLDATSSFAGGPAIVSTAEVGTRFHRERTESRAYPFVDLRVGYINAYDSPWQDNLYTPGQPANGFHHSNGLGLVGGLGTELALTRRFSLTTGVSVMQNHMVGYSSSGSTQIRQSYTLTSYRLVLGLRYNPVRFIVAPPNGLPASSTP